MDHVPPPADPVREAPTELTGWERPIGRGAFLATVLTGLGALTLLSRASGLSRAVTNVTSAVKPGGSWRIYAVASPLPKFDPASYRLRITGAVENPIELGWDEVQAWRSHPITADFHCVTGWSVMDVHWAGILPADIVARVKPTRKAKFVSMHSLEDPYVDQVTMEQFLEAGNVLAHTMDGEPLTREHGAPLRMVLPDMYGYKGVKWVKEIRFDSEQMSGYWEQRGYDTDAYVGRSNGYGG
ncbi:MAG: molybdopterin-dependent oxidoreductase [Thermoleophilia bacterium]|nr:molybdopterin-dependent oxidoreductase [Thermoleophilia bacterium]